MLLNVFVLLGLFVPAASSPPAGNLVRVDFSGEIRTTTGDPFGQSYEHWKLEKVSGYFVYDPETPNALTPEEVKRKRTVKIAGKKTKRTFKQQTTHIYLQNLAQPSFELDIPGHKIVGSRRSLIHIKYHELDTTNSQFLFKDGRSAYVRYKKRKQHGRLTIDGEKVESANFQLHFFDQGQKLESANLPKQFPFALGEDLKVGASVDVNGSGIMFEITKMTWKTISR